MPEARLTRARLGAHLRRCWIAYLAGALALCFLNNLIYTVTRPTASEAETLRVMLLNVEFDPDEDAQAALLEEVRRADPEIRELEFETLVSARADDAYSGMLLVTKLVAGYGDLYLTDAEGFGLLADRGACLNLDDIALDGASRAMCADLETGAEYTGAFCVESAALGEVYLVVMANGENIDAALAALPLLAAVVAE